MLRIRVVRTIGHHALLVRTERHGRASGAAHRGPACDGQAGEKRVCAGFAIAMQRPRTLLNANRPLENPQSGKRRRSR
ncbi:hypothetical protein C7S14_2441 [Burkholderia cepacia]|nr:hypothetical protein C7S14_2441 [Burkholderia cepacia]